MNLESVVVMLSFVYIADCMEAENGIPSGWHVWEAHLVCKYGAVAVDSFRRTDGDVYHKRDCPTQPHHASQQIDVAWQRSGPAAPHAYNNQLVHC